jgi:outer membrane protein assembly factor BamB
MVRFCLPVAMLFAVVLSSLLGDAAELKAPTAEWPSWRGPNRDGISTEKGLLQEWPEDGPTLSWQASGLGKGMSSVAISGGRIFTMGNLKGGTALIAMNLEDGSILWESPVGGGNPNCTPTVDGDLVYALGRSGDLVCVEAATGKEVWRTVYKRDFGGKMMSGWGYSESPLIDGDRLICTPGANDAMIAALDKKTGKVIWKAEQPKDVGNRGNDGAAYSSIVVSKGAGVKQYIQLTGRGIISVDAKTGQTLWTYNKIANGTANIPTPIVKDDYVFCSSGYGGGGAALLKLTSGGAGKIDVEEVYYRSSRELQNHHGGMILIGDHVYMGHGHNKGFPTCVELKTGKIAWGRNLRGPGGDSAAIVYADGHLYFRYQDGIMALIEATPEEYRLKSSFKLASVKGQSWPHPVIAGGRLYLRDQNVLMCYDIRK